MTVKRRLRALVLSLPLVAATAQPAAAHPEATPAGVSRYVTAAVVDGHIEVSDAWFVGAVPAVEQRRKLDGDGDGLISDDERARGEAAIATEPPVLSVAVDGVERAEAAVVSIDLGGQPRTGDAPLVIERRRTVLLATGAGVPHSLRLGMRREPPRLLETEVAIDLQPGIVLAGTTDRVRWNGPRGSALEDRSATFAFGPPAPVAPAWPLPVGLTAGGLALALGVALAARARLRRRAAQVSGGRGIDARM